MTAQALSLGVVQGGLSDRIPQMTSSKTHDLSTLRRGIEILQVLQQWTWREDVGGWGNNRIAEYLGADKSQVSRTLKVLMEAGWVERDEETRTYRLGPGIYSLGMRAADQHLMRVGAAVVRRAVTLTGCRVFLVVRQGACAVTVWSDQPADVRPIVDSIGMTYPVVATDTGRALLFATSAPEIREILGDGTPDDPRVEEFIARVERDRRVGYSHGLVSGDENGVVAVPIWTTGRKVVAAIGAAGSPLADRAEVVRVARVLLAAAAEVTRHQTAELRKEVAVSSVPYEGWPELPKMSDAQ